MRATAADRPRLGALTRPITPRAGVKTPLAARAALAVEVVVTYVRARWRVRRNDLPTALAELRDTRVAGAADAWQSSGRHATAVRIAGLSLRTLRWLPADSRCLMRSLVVTGLLARREIDVKFIVAVRPGSEEFAAHAWVELNGRALLPPGTPPFERIAEL